MTTSYGIRCEVCRMEATLTGTDVHLQRLLTNKHSFCRCADKRSLKVIHGQLK